jgi:hypothetical protein
MKIWRRTSKVDNLLKICSRNAQKVSPRFEQAIKSSKGSPKGKEYSSPSQIITKNTFMVSINPTHVDQPSNLVRNIFKSDEKEVCSGISNVACVEGVHV